MPIRKSSISGSSSYNAGNTASRPANPANGQLYFDTQINGLLVYSNDRWMTYQAPEAIIAPTSVVATNQGSNRAFDNGQMSVAFSLSSELGGPVSTYTVTSTPGSLTATGTSSPITITGLSSNTGYTFTVTGSNSYSSAVSSASSSVTATTVPQAPTISAVNPSNSSASVSITANGTGGSAITSYVVTPYLSGVAQTPITAATSPVNVTGLTNGQNYTFKATAVNANGESLQSTETVSYLIEQQVLEYLVIGGGEAGDGPGGGEGGNAGQYQTASNFAIQRAFNYTVTVGAGGIANGGDGGNSVFGSITSTGGAGSTTNGGGTGASGTSSTINGAPGLASSITGTSVIRAGGGGNGGAGCNGGFAPGIGGAGGGGTGGQGSTGGTGAANTGSGGGGGSRCWPYTQYQVATYQNGGNGGSGVVILKYSSALTPTVSAGLTSSTETSGEYKITTFTAGTGTITWS
jgi:hypothetical protein